MWRVIPIYRVRTSARYGIAKYRRSEEVTCIRPKGLYPCLCEPNQGLGIEGGNYGYPGSPH